jgi:Ca2+-binding EF-hand superfamily protein
MAFFANSMMQRYDKDGSGVLEKSEWASFRTDPSPGDTNKDGKLTKDELTKWMSSRFGQSRGGGDSARGSNDRGSAGRGGSSQGGGRGSSGRGSSDRGSSDRGGSQRGSRGGDSNSDTAESYRFKTLGERLPEGLPEWFKSNDGNGDGQIMMSEYAKNWNAKMLDSFDKFDFNADGVITPEECLDAIDEGVSYGGGESSRGRGSSDNNKSDGRQKTDSSKSTDSSSGSSRYAKYANGIMEKHDTDKNGSLNNEEWSKNRWIKESFDKDGDGKMTIDELTKGFGGK